MNEYLVKNELKKDYNYDFGRCWTVYVHIFPKEVIDYDYDKYYVGITSQGTGRRWRPDGSGYDNQTAMRNAINKYGWENMQHEIIAEYLTEEEAKELERALIKKLGSHGKYGYNGTDGGDDIGVKKDLTNKKYSHVTVLGPDKERGENYWILQCDCEDHTIFSRHRDSIVYQEYLACESCTSKHRKMMLQKYAKYGDKNARIYSLWRKIRKASSPTNHTYDPDLIVYQPWRDDFLLFQDWCLNNGYVEGYRFVRLDRSKGFMPGNCIWAETLEKDMSITGKAKRYEYEGELLTAKEWASKLCIPYPIFKKRLSKMDLEKAITLPYYPRKKKKGVNKHE